MSSPKAALALRRLGEDVRAARLRRRIAMADLAARAGTSPSSIMRLERGDPGVGIGTLADVLVVLGLIERLADLVDVKKDELGLALSSERLPRRGKTFASALRRRRRADARSADAVDVDPDGVAF